MGPQCLLLGLLCRPELPVPFCGVQKPASEQQQGHTGASVSPAG